MTRGRMPLRSSRPGGQCSSLRAPAAQPALTIALPLSCPIQTAATYAGGQCPPLHAPANRRCQYRFFGCGPHQGLACPMARFNTSHLTVRPGGQCPPLHAPAPAVPSATVSPMRSILRQTTTHRIRQIAGIRRLRNDVGESIALPLGCKTLREPNALPLYAYRLDARLTLQRQRQARCP